MQIFFKKRVKVGWSDTHRNLDGITHIFQFNSHDSHGFSIKSQVRVVNILTARVCDGQTK